MLATGVDAPGFSLSDSNGKTVALEDFRGKWVVFWWYPEANSSGCSIQAASLESSLDELTGDDVVVLGASFNTVHQNDDFACDKSLRLVLLSDPEMKAGKQYEVIRDPSDRHPTKPYRYTYIVDPSGRIVHAEDANEVSLSAYGPHVVETVRKLRAGSAQ